MKKLFLFFAGVFIFPACTPYFIANSFEQDTADHQVVAILPFEMLYTGLLPEGLSEDDILVIGEAEAKAFQISFYNEILRSTRSGKRDIYVSLQDFRTTVKLLEDSEQGLAIAWLESPENLANLLGVDAVLRGRIEKNRLMTDLESYGISVAIRILDILSPQGIWPWLPPGINRAKEIDASYALFDGREGKLLWNIAFQVNADWRRRSDEIIDEVNRRGARRFPYRN